MITRFEFLTPEGANGPYAKITEVDEYLGDETERLIYDFDEAKRLYESIGL